MALSYNEKQEIINMLDSMERSRAQAALSSKRSFFSWLRSAARWLVDRITESVLVVLFDWVLDAFDS